MPTQTDILIAGGGLAGLTAGLHLARQGFGVVVLEKQPYPQHKVCGEYISNEVRPYLTSLGIEVDTLNPARISKFLLTTLEGKSLRSALPLGGFGVSRYRLDAYLYQQARKAGVQIEQAHVQRIDFDGNRFTVTTSEDYLYEAPVVIAAYGKRSRLDSQTPLSPWMAVKAHYRVPFPDDLVSLHTFRGGYCGISQVEDEVVNACYLVQAEVFKPYKNPETFQQQVLSQNPFLRDFFERAEPLFDKPLAISQISFASKPAVENHVLRCGDTAGLIHPLCGNGMAMAIHSAKLAAEAITAFFHHADRSKLEAEYTRQWNQNFRNRLTAGRLVQSLLQRPVLTSLVMKSAPLFAGLLPAIVRQTHGKPFSYAPEYS
ncbi:NAD(P)/FAD-dependent oxidoreductase [Siphonobacter curvatus]|uniref:FAD-dependent oxidoreductase n=1 Tax=Siphonobacter curvatus TaxID=2094562 RepID=A0A2S7IIE3_9BACT|nr:FAD-dependent oxidoreductase [Siphonobacter curvatus]PQA55715.1 FAD-dependent oxidoreductase [Siphonobacter curvatus]